MDTNPAIRVLLDERKKAQERIDALQAEIREARAALRSFDETLSRLGIEGGEMRELVPRTSGSGTLKERVFLAVAHGYGKSTADLVRAIEAQGREVGLNTVLSTLSRLKQEHRIVKRDRAWFVVTPSDEEPNETAPDNESGAA